MLGFKYVVAKSKELQGKLERTATGVSSSSAGASSASPSSRYSARAVLSTSSATESTDATSRTRGASSPTSGRNEGESFLTLQQRQWEKALNKHEQLLESGDKLGDALGAARKKLADQVESEQFIQQNFHQVAKVREQIARMRGLVAKIAEDIEDVEQFLVQQTEEYMAAQNASFASRQQEEIELFELRILDEKEDLKRQLLEERRQQLARAFQNDIKTYQTLVTYQGESLPQTVISEEAYTPVTLESIDLIVTADAEQLDAFYLSASEGEESDIEVENQDPTLTLKIQTQEKQAESVVESTQVETSSHVQEQKQSVEIADLGAEEEEETKEEEQDEDDKEVDTKSVEEAVVSLAS